MNKEKNANNNTLLEERIEKIVENNQSENGRVLSIKTDRITELRKMRGFNSVRDFAKYIEENLGGFVSKSMLESLETTDKSKKKKPLTLDMALQFAKAFNVSLDWLFSISDDMNNKSSNIETALRTIFNFETIELKFENEEGIPYTEEFLTFSFSNDLRDFLINTKEISQMRHKGQLSEDTYTSALDDLRKSYDREVAVKNKDIKSTCYVLMPHNHSHIVDNLI